MAGTNDCCTVVDSSLSLSHDRLSHFSHAEIFLCCLDSYFQVSITRKCPLLAHVDTKRYITADTSVDVYRKNRKKNKQIVYGR